jgi:PAS domain S-box-containing protein
VQVLVIEDDDNVTLLYRIALERAGHDVATAPLGRSGLELARERPFDLVVLDGMLPDIDGLDVLAQLRGDEATRELPVVMASARVGKADQDAALAAGADAYVLKPFHPAELADVIAEVAGGARPAPPGSGAEGSSPGSGGARRTAQVIWADRHGRRRPDPSDAGDEADPRAQPPGAGEPRPAVTGHRHDESSLARVLALAFDAIVSIDDAQRIVGFNKGAEDTFGYLAEEVLGKPLGILMPERFTYVHQEHVRSFAEGRESGRLMGGQRFVYARRRDGSEFPAEASITKLEIDGRSVLTAILRDATERQRTEAELRTRADQQAAVAELGLRAITVGSLDELLDDAVRTLVRILDIDLVKVALLEAGSKDVMLAAGSGWVAGAVGNVRCDAGAGTLVGISLEKDEPLVFADVYADHRFRPDQLLIDHDVTSGVHVTIRGRVRPVGLIGVYTKTRRVFTDDDVHVVQAVANVVASGVQRDAHERRLRSFLDAAPDATLIVDPAGRIVNANAQCEVLFGYTREELQRLSVDALVPDGARARHSGYRRAFEQERRARAMGEGLELVARRRDGSTVPVDIMLRPFDTDEGAFVVAAVRDITDRRRNETAREAFLHAVSHELRTPLTAVLGFSSLLTDHFPHELGGEARPLVDRIHASASKLDRLLADLLDLDRLGRGVLEAQRRDVELLPLVQHAVESVQLEGRALTVVVDPPDLVASVDAAQVERIVENLVVNAVRHTPVGSRIEVLASPSANGVMLRVEDDGYGVPAEIRGQIFEPFRRKEGTSAPGTGIGLSLVARFAELHGGRAWVEDRPGGGASFRVVLSQ